MFIRLITGALLACVAAWSVPAAIAQPHLPPADPSVGTPLSAFADWAPATRTAAAGYPGEYPGGYPSCPSGTTGTYPTCTAPTQCPAGTTGTPPNCLSPARCPAGTTGTPPNCLSPTRCPADTSGTPPNCVPLARPGTTRNAIVKLRAGRRFFADSRGRVKLGTASCAMAAKQCRTVRTRLERPRRPKAAAYGSGKLKVAPGQVKTLRVTLSPAARRTLRRKRSLRTRIVIRNGTAKPIVRTVTLRRR